MSNLPIHHKPNGRFQNPPGSPPNIAGPGTLLRFGITQLFRDQLPPLPKNHRISEEQSRANFDRSAGTESVTWLGHAAFLLRMAGKHILLDPFLSERAGPFGVLGPRRFCPPGMTVELLPRIDFLILSHNHYDHCDRTTLEAIPHKERIEVLAPLGLKPLLIQCGFTKIYELDWYQSVRFGQLNFTALPAVHMTSRNLLDFNRCLWASFAIEGPQHRVFFSGDTAYGKVFDEIGARAGPFDLALLGIGAYEPRKVMRPYHAAPEEAIMIGLDLQARYLLGMHWGSIVLSAEPPFEPPDRFRKAGIEAGLPEEHLWILRVGETRALPT